MAIRLRDPFAALLAMQDAMDRATRSDWFGSRTSGRGVYPPVNVFRQGEDFVIVAELPGVKKDELEITVKADQVRIVGKKTTDAPEGASVHRRERGTGDFDRSLSLPAKIDSENAKAEFHDGLLALHLPRAASDKARSIAIH